MTAESGETKKPPGAAKAAAKKPAKSAGAAAGKPAGASAKKPAKKAASKKPARSAPTAAAATKSASKKPAKRAGGGPRKPAKAASPAAGKPAPPAAKAEAAAGRKAAPASAQAKRTVVKDAASGYFDALVARDAAAAALAWDPEGVNDVVPVAIFRGRAAIRGFLEELFAAIPDGRFTVERIIADDTAASVQWRIAGTFDGSSFQGLEPTGRRVDLRGSDCLEIEDGKIVRNTAVFDGAAFARQVGLLPAEDSGADRAIRAGFNTVTKLRRTVARRTAR